MKISSRVKGIEPAVTLATAELAKKMKAEGKPVLSFGAGEPDFNSPKSAVDAAIDAIKRGETHYTASSGIAELKTAVSEYYKLHFGLDYANNEIIITCGAKPLIYEALQTLVDPGDEVIVFAPAWVSYVEQIRLSQGVDVAVDTINTGFVPARAALEGAVTKRTVGMIVNTPNNPTGAMYDEATLRMLADVAVKHNLWIIFDEIYERLAYGGKRHINILNVVPEIRDRVVLANGVSKAYSMTGWRIGYALSEKGVISKMGDIQSHLTANPTSIAQWASVGAIKGAEGDVERCRAEFERRRDLIYGLISGIKGLKIQKPDGAFYAFFDIRETPLPNDKEFCRRLLEEKYVAAVPGTAFLAPGFVRMSYACSDNTIRDGLARLAEFVKTL